MRFKHLLLASAALLMAGSAARADEFFDTSESESIMNLGARIGINCSNQTSSGKGLDLNLDSWGTGFDAGVICDLNLRNFISIQPGFFFESRSNNYSYVYPVSIDGSNYSHEYGHTRHYTFKIPILASLRLNPADNMRWSIDFGPYFSFGLGGSDKGKIPTNPSVDGLSRDYVHYDDGYYDRRNKFDFGFKMGTGLQYAGHYYIGIHYEAGACNVWKNNRGGRHKAWMFTLGYDF